MPHVSTTLGRLFVEERGSGRPVVFWHSLLCDSSMWRHQAEDLARDHRVVLVDGPAHGRSESPSPELGRELLGIIRRADRAGLARAIAAVVIDRTSVLSRLSSVRVPTLVVVGEEDRATTPNRARRIAGAIPGARLEIVPGAGHLSAI